MVQEQVQLSDLTLEERARRDGAEIDVDHVYHDEVTEYHDARAAALAAAPLVLDGVDIEVSVSEDPAVGNIG